MRENAVRRTGALAAAVALTLAAASGGPAAADLTPGGGFESGSFPAGWVHSGGNLWGGTNDSWADHDVVLDLPHTGAYSVLLGFKYTRQQRNRYGFMYTDVSIPSNISRATLFFRYRQQGYDGLNYDPFEMSIRSTSGALLATVADFSFSEWNNQFKDSGWIEDDGDGTPGYDMTVFAGRTVRLDFRQHNTWDNLYETWVFVDDVSMVFYRFVDLAVDGDGDDIFGDPGTGAGGTGVCSGEVGETVSYHIDIENEGLDVDSYTISVSPPAGWTASIRYGGVDYPLPWVTPDIPPGSSTGAEVLLGIPPGESIGDYQTVLDAVSGGNRYDSVLLATGVVPADFLADLTIDSNGSGIIDPLGGGGVSFGEAVPDTTIEFSLELFNSGVMADSFDVWFDATSPLGAAIDDGATAHSAPFVTGPVPAGGSALMTLVVTVPLSVTGGDYGTVVYARSRGDATRQDAVTAMTRVRAPRVDMIISGSGDGIYADAGTGGGGTGTIAGRRGNTVIFPVIVQNESGAPDSFVLDWERPGGGWSAVIYDGAASHGFPWTTSAFGPNSQRSYSLMVTIPSNASYDTYISILDAVSEVDSDVTESVTAGVTVASGNETDVMIDGNGGDSYGALGTGLGGSSSVTASPGDTVAFEISVENEGGANTFDLQWTSPPGWTVLLDGSPSPLSNWSAGTYTLQAIIPAGIPGGTFDIVFDALKSNKRYFVDSVTGTVFVVPPRLVDGLIDGDGDGVFGAPGTGAGGFSSQVTFGGRNVSFTVEIQNEGAQAEAYTIDWNPVPGWTATMGGQTAPFTTPSILPGNSRLLVFQSYVPASASPGDHDYIVEIVSAADPSSSESITARITVTPPPALDLVIEGSGAFVTGIAGSGAGGLATVFGEPGSVVSASLEVVNRGGFPDSFRIVWADPAGWPAGSVVIFDGTADHASPFVTPPIGPGGSLTFTMRASVPASAGLRTGVVIDGESMSGDLEDSVLLEIATSAFVAGLVFEDDDHDGVHDPGEPGVTGVFVSLPSAGLAAGTSADGSFIFEIPSGDAGDVMAVTPAGMMSLSPDTVPAGYLQAGDTVFVEFADVYLSSIAPPHTRSGPAGGWVDLPHTITAGTAGQASVAASLPAGWVEVWYRDADGDGLLGAADPRLSTADLDLDPDLAGRDVVTVIVRVYIPASAPAGTVASAGISLQQTLSGTAITTASALVDEILVTASGSGLLEIVKDVDLPAARPGETVTYSVTLTNPGTEGITGIVVVDPVSPLVELVTGAFGAGNDIAWTTGGSTAYFTADPGDADEALYDPAGGILRIVLSRQAPFVLGSGETGRLEYRVRIR